MTVFSYGPLREFLSTEMDAFLARMNEDVFGGDCPSEQLIELKNHWAKE